MPKVVGKTNQEAGILVSQSRKQAADWTPWDPCSVPQRGRVCWRQRACVGEKVRRWGCLLASSPPLLKEVLGNVVLHRTKECRQCDPVQRLDKQREACPRSFWEAALPEAATVTTLRAHTSGAPLRCFEEQSHFVPMLPIALCGREEPCCLGGGGTVVGGLKSCAPGPPLTSGSVEARALWPAAPGRRPWWSR